MQNFKKGFFTQFELIQILLDKNLLNYSKKNSIINPQISNSRLF